MPHIQPIIDFRDYKPSTAQHNYTLLIAICITLNNWCHSDTTNQCCECLKSSDKRQTYGDVNSSIIKPLAFQSSFFCKLYNQ